MERDDTQQQTCPDIGAYAAIGNCHGMGLISNEGSLDWCALQSLDATPTCFRLLDDRIGGYLAIRPAGAFQVSRRYLPHTNVLETTFRTDTGVATLIDFMPIGRRPGAAADDFVTLEAPPWLVRLVHVTEGELSLELDMLPSVAWGTCTPDLRREEHGVSWGGGTLLCDRPIEVHGVRARSVAHLRAGERMRVMLMAGRCALPEVALSRLDQLLNITVAYWCAWAARGSYNGPYADAVERSALALKLLTYAPTGAIVAAPTTSLPEVLGGERNWDYRLSWVRDATLTLFALSALGYHEEPEAFRKFLFEYGAGAIFPTQIVYGIHGELDLVERELTHLSGYQGSHPVRVGNAAYRQRQFDVYGEVMDWLALRSELGGTLQPSERDLLQRTADYVAAHWREPGQGFWEERNEPHHFVYGKMMCWVALDRAQELLGCRDYEPVMDAIVHDVHRRGIAPAGYLRKRYDNDEIDATALRAPVIDFPLPPGCLEATLDAVMTQLVTSRGVYRYRGKDGLEGEEGTFVACGFWLVDALLFAGKTREARAWFEGMLGLANDVGLYAEEIDPQNGRFLGNFPQGLSHLALIHGAALLDFVERGGPDALQGTHADRVRHASRMMEDARKAKETPSSDTDDEAWVLDLAALGLG